MERVYDESGTLVGSYKSHYSYNATDSLVKTLIQSQDAGAVDWNDYTLITRTFDAGGTQLLTEEIDYEGFGTWIKVKLATFTYNSKGQRITENYQNWDGTAWVNDFKNLIDYNGTGKIDAMMSIMWDDTGAEDSARAQYTYNGDNLTNLITTEFLDHSTHTFLPDMKTVYYYNDKATSIDNVNRGGSLSIYPVPAHDQLTLDLQWDKVQQATVSITDLQGRVWQQWALPAVQQHKEQVALSNLPSGNYILCISGSDNARVTQQFTVVR